MPRYAIGSLEHAIYEDVVACFQNDSPETRANGTVSRAHRAEAFLQEPRSDKDKVIAIKMMCRIHENRWATDVGTLEVVRSIVTE